MVLRPDSDFFKYFVDPAGKAQNNNNKDAAPAPAPAR
jgi:hypothetical protein